MKNVFTKISAVVLVVWYSLSVIGFDVHTCSISGETYIATVVGGMSCDDIHPESHGLHVHEHHDGCSCCDSHDTCEEGIGVKSCCTDDYQVISLTGVRGGGSEDSDVTVNVNVSFLQREVSDDLYSALCCPGLRVLSRPGSVGVVPRNVQASYNIWRI